MQEKSLESTEIFNTVLGIVSLCIYLFSVSIIFAIHFMIFLPSAFDKTKKKHANLVSHEMKSEALSVKEKLIYELHTFLCNSRILSAAKYLHIYRYS